MKHSHRVLLFCAGLVLGGCSGQAKVDDAESAKSDKAAPPKVDDAVAVQGTWTIVSVEDSGRAIPAEELKEFRMVITADTITRVNKDKADKPQTYKLDSTKSPKWFDMTGSRTLMGIYELQGDTLKICVNDGRSTVRSTAFESKADSENDGYMVLKREAPATK